MKTGRCGQWLVVLLAAWFCGSAAAAPVDTSAPAPLKVVLSYDFYVGGARSFNLQATAEAAEGQYRIRTESRTDGFIDFLLRFSQSAESEGLLLPDRLQPTRHEATSQGRLMERHVTITWDAAGSSAHAIVVPPPEAEDRQPVPPALTIDAMDPLTAIFAVASGAFGGTPCPLRLPIFDGRRRYDLIAEAGEKTDLPANRYAVYAGPALQCRLRLAPIAGFAPDTSTDVAEPDKPSEIWLARIGGRLTVPVRFELQSRFGGVIGHLVGAEIDNRLALDRVGR